MSAKANKGEGVERASGLPLPQEVREHFVSILESDPEIDAATGQVFSQLLKTEVPGRDDILERVKTALANQNEAENAQDS